MEAMRILKATGLRLRRTVRLALWTGEEQGLLGSRAYVKQQFGDRDTMALKPGHAKLSAYFNMDNGTGAIRGVYLQGNEAVRPVFAPGWSRSRNLGMTTLAIRNTGATDHVSFDEVGLPGFQFIQDPVEYGTHSHHTQHGRLRPPAGRGPDEERRRSSRRSSTTRPTATRCCRASRCRGPPRPRPAADAVTAWSWPSSLPSAAAVLAAASTYAVTRSHGARQLAEARSACGRRAGRGDAGQQVAAQEVERQQRRPRRHAGRCSTRPSDSCARRSSRWPPRRSTANRGAFLDLAKPLSTG